MRRRRLRRALSARRAFGFRTQTPGRFCVVVATALGLVGATADSGSGDCIVVHERTPQYTPHVAIHFGPPADVPRDIRCATTIDRNADTFCVPLYAYNLWDGVSAFELALRLPVAPLAFDADPAIASSTVEISPGANGIAVGLRLLANAPLCGPVRLGCARFATAELPDVFAIDVEAHPVTNRRAACDPRGNWRSLAVDAGGAHIGLDTECPRGPCAAEAPVTALAASSGDEPGVLEFEWQSGSGSYTLFCVRTDGRYPADPWDGRFLALLPSDVRSYTHRFEETGTVHVAAWSVTRGAFGALHATSNMECGGLVSALVDMPIGIATRSWGDVKALFR